MPWIKPHNWRWEEYVGFRPQTPIFPSRLRTRYPSARHERKGSRRRQGEKVARAGALAATRRLSPPTKRESGIISLKNLPDVCAGDILGVQQSGIPFARCAVVARFQRQRAEG